MFTVRNVLPLLLVVLLLCGLSFGGTFWTVKQNGTGDYTTIQAALNAAAEPNTAPPAHPWPIIIEVQDNGTYTGNLAFPSDVNGLTLRAGAGFSPTINVVGTGGTPPVDTNEFYIDIVGADTTLQGFTINFTGTAYTVDNNSFMIHARGGAQNVWDCNVFGPSTPFNAISRGIAGVNDINNVEISQCRIGILCDANWFVTKNNYVVRNSWIHDNRHFGIVLHDCNAVVDNCLIEKSGAGFPTGNSNISTDDANELEISYLNVLVKNSTIQTMLGTGRNITLSARGTVDINDCIIRDAKFDEILQYRGTLNLKRCILKNTDETGGCVAVVRQEGTTQQGGTVNIDHCNLESCPSAMTQWALWTGDPTAVVNIKNSILTGTRGYHASVAYGSLSGPLGTFPAGSFTSNYNDNDCNQVISDSGRANGIVAGPQDISPKQDPFYIQTVNSSNDANLITFFALQPYSPIIGKGESDSNLGATGVVYGYEKWPADLDHVYGVDVNDLKVFSSRWLDDSNIVPAGPNSLLDNSFEDLTILDANISVPNWTYWLTPSNPKGPADPCYNLPGTSTLKLLKVSDGCDVYDGNKAIRWVYDVNEGVPQGLNRFTEILLILPQTIDINVFPDANGQPGSRFNQLKVMVKRHAGNSPSNETFMYVKFLDKTKFSPTTSYQKEDQIAHIVGGATDINEGEWVPWTSNFSSMGFDITLGLQGRLQKIGAIVLGVAAQPDGPWGLGQGIIDIDKIELIDTPGCTGYPIGDIRLTNGIGDCIVNFRDYVIFANYWLDGK